LVRKKKRRWAKKRKYGKGSRKKETIQKPKENKKIK